MFEKELFSSNKKKITDLIEILTVSMEKEYMDQVCTGAQEFLSRYAFSVDQAEKECLTYKSVFEIFSTIFVWEKWVEFTLSQILNLVFFFFFFRILDKILVFYNVFQVKCP